VVLEGWSDVDELHVGLRSRGGDGPVEHRACGAHELLCVRGEHDFELRAALGGEQVRVVEHDDLRLQSCVLAARGVVSTTERTGAVRWPERGAGE
jgi:hypothetical protein